MSQEVTIKPNFVCIGSQKAGTTWLHRNLSVHPQVWFPPVKEIHYFNQIHFNENFIEKGRLRRLARAIEDKVEGKDISYGKLNFLARFALREKKNDQWYLSLFKEAKPNCIVGDITPAYSAIPSEGVKHMKELLGDIKIIYIMRHPVKRAWSHALMDKRKSVKKGKEISTQEWMKIVKNKNMRLRGSYKRTIENYEKFFDPNNILYLFYDQIRIEPLKFLETVCNFLDIDYQEKYFSKIVNEVYNKNPKLEMPDRVREYLVEEYKAEEDWVRKRFNPESFKF